MTGLPIYPSIWTAVVAPTDSPSVVRVYPPDTILSSTNMIFLGMRNHEYPDGAEGLCTDAQRDFPGTYLSTDGGLTWQAYSGYGDWHIRACLTYPDAVQEAFENASLSCRLFPIAPNPFRELALFQYSLPSASHVNLSVYDAGGGLVAVLVDEYQGPGVYRARWSAEEQPVGVYFCQMQAGDFVETVKAILLK